MGIADLGFGIADCGLPRGAGEGDWRLDAGCGRVGTFIALRAAGSREIETTDWRGFGRTWMNCECALPTEK